MAFEQMDLCVGWRDREVSAPRQGSMLVSSEVAQKELLAVVVASLPAPQLCTRATKRGSSGGHGTGRRRGGGRTLLCKSRGVGGGQPPFGRWMNWPVGEESKEGDDVGPIC